MEKRRMKAVYMRKVIKNKTFVCDSYETWTSTRLIRDPTCIFAEMPDIHERGPLVLSQRVIFDCCDKNFIYYHLNKDTFRRTDTIILNSHPCEPKVVRYLQDEADRGVKVYFTEPWKLFVQKWAHSGSRIKILPKDEYEKAFPPGMLDGLRQY